MHLSSERIPSVCEYSGDFAYLLELKDMLFLLGFLYRVHFFFYRSDGDVDIAYAVEWKTVYVYPCVSDMQ